MLPLHSTARVLLEREDGLVVLEKPEGLMTHPNVQADERRSLLVCHYDRKAECYRWGRDGRERLWLGHRLDSATSGLILAAREEGLAREIKQAFAQRLVKKCYVALAFGCGPQERVTWRDGLRTERVQGRLRSEICPRGEAAITQARMVMWGHRGRLMVCRLELEPETGRPHQLRVQCAGHGLPLVGDQTYGDFSANRAWLKAGGSKRLFLHAWKLALPALGPRSPAATLESPVPELFALEVAGG